MTRLPLLCPQLYEGTDMRVTPCTRCPSGWSKALGRCTIETGAEHLPDVAPEDVPTCPIQDRCQHHVQSSGVCAVRRKGMVCESAFTFAGMDADEAMDRPLAFSAMMMA